MKRILIWLCLFVGSAFTTNAQNAPTTLKLFLDCNWSCDTNYIKQEIPYIEYVTDREVADIHLLVTAESTGGGGTVYLLDFIGLKDFLEQDQTLKATTLADDSDDQERRKMTHQIKLGLMRYLVNTSVAENLTIGYSKPKESTSASAKDPWNLWSFSTRFGGNLQSESNYNATSGSISISANRTSDKWKTRLSAYTRASESNFKISDEETIESSSSSSSLSASAIYALAEKWSLKEQLGASKSSFQNMDLRYYLSSGVEYSVFPYTESTRRALNFQYEIELSQNNYTEQTIYGKEAEMLLQESIKVIVAQQQPWGSVALDLTGSHYFHDFSKYRVSVGGNIDWRIAKGLSIVMGGDISYIRDQLSLPGGGLSTDEILLRQKELATNYTYQTFVGLTYRFGSTSNNIVNSRYSSGGGRIFYGF